jgi:hypothetical protein
MKRTDSDFGELLVETVDDILEDSPVDGEEDGDGFIYFEFFLELILFLRWCAGMAFIMPAALGL